MSADLYLDTLHIDTFYEKKKQAAQQLYKQDFNKKPVVVLEVAVGIK